MDSTFKIIPFKEDHATRIVEIRKTELLKEIDDIDFTQETATKLINELSVEKLLEITKEPDRTTLTAINLDGEVIGVGMVVVNVLDTSKFFGKESIVLSEEKEPKCNIRLVFIDEKYQKYGIGKKRL
jgi:hypothetical protein